MKHPPSVWAGFWTRPVHVSSQALKFVATFLLLFVMLFIGQDAFAADPWRTESFSLAPKAGGAPYLIEVAYPAGPAPPSGYPVMYVVDAVGLFATLADTVHMQEQLFGPVVVVGIRYEDALETRRRIFDFTIKPDSGAGRQTNNVGGADAFLAFMLDELKPAVAQRVKVDATRQALFGHSLGGLFALHVLLTRPQSFDTYVIAR